MKDKFLENIKKYNLIEKQDKILVGLSGGMDSVSLLYLLDEYKYLFSSLGAVHINHSVRGDEAARDEDFCKYLCNGLDIPFYYEKVDMNGYALEKKISKEEAGRILRKDVFYKISKEHGYNKIALAHNKNDQAETLLMRIFRGTGIDGLSGIEYKSNNIIRPLLNIKRSEIEEFIKYYDLEYVHDSTNSENDYLRNKIRNIIIPTIENTLDENIIGNVFNLSELSKVDTDYLEKITEKNFINSCKIYDYYIQLDIEKFKNLDDSIKNRLIRKIFFNINGNIKNLSRKNVEDIVELMSLSSGKEIENINDVNIRKSFDYLIFSKNLDKPKDFYYKLCSNSSFYHDDYLIKIEDSDKIIDLENSFSIPVDMITGDLVIRNRKAGDKIFLPNRSSIKKLKDVFINNRIDKVERDRYLVVADDERVYWVYGLIKSKQFFDKDNNYKVIYIDKENKNA